MEAAIEQVREQLRQARRAADFTGLLAAHKEIGRLCALKGAYAEAAASLEKAAQVAGYLGKPNEAEALYHSLVAIQEQAGDPHGVIDAYCLLFLLMSVKGDIARARQYSEVRLGLVARQMGKTHLSMAELMQYESAASSKKLERINGRYARLLRGEEEPTIPDEYAEACDSLVQLCLIEGRYDDALHYVSACEQAMRDAGPWVSANGIKIVSDLKQVVADRAREDG